MKDHGMINCVFKDISAEEEVVVHENPYKIGCVDF